MCHTQPAALVRPFTKPGEMRPGTEAANPAQECVGEPCVQMNRAEHMSSVVSSKLQCPLLIQGASLAGNGEVRSCCIREGSKGDSLSGDASPWQVEKSRVYLQEDASACGEAGPSQRDLQADTSIGFIRGGVRPLPTITGL